VSPSVLRQRLRINDNDLDKHFFYTIDGIKQTVDEVMACWKQMTEEDPALLNRQTRFSEFYVEKDKMVYHNIYKYY
jgi:hypothetical protein